MITTGALATEERKLEILLDARKLIETPRRWIKGRQHKENLVRPDQYCLIGAVTQAAGSKSSGYRIRPLLDEAIESYILTESTKYYMFIPGIENFNDEVKSTHSDVLAVLDIAINNTRVRIQKLTELQESIEKKKVSDLYVPEGFGAPQSLPKPPPVKTHDQKEADAPVHDKTLVGV